MAKPTMYDVARLAGVNVSTVSRALNDRTASMLRPDTVARIHAVSEEIGYRLNTIARGLRTQRTSTVGMVVPDLTNPFFPPIVRGVDDELGKAGYAVIIANTDNDPEHEGRGLAGLLSRQVDGLVLATSHLEAPPAPELLGDVPIVLVNRRDQEVLTPFVVPDDEAGVRLVIDHFASLGHRLVGHVAGPQDTSTGRARRDVFTALAAQSGLTNDLIEAADLFDSTAGEQACNRLLDIHPELTAIFAANDLIAIGCLRACRARGLGVPDDVSLVGYNDMPLVDLLDPPLTTVRVPQYEMGRRAAVIMLELLEQHDTETDPRERQVKLAPTLVVRRSTARADQGAT